MCVAFAARSPPVSRVHGPSDRSRVAPSPIRLAQVGLAPLELLPVHLARGVPLPQDRERFGCLSRPPASRAYSTTASTASTPSRPPSIQTQPKPPHIPPPWFPHLPVVVMHPGVAGVAPPVAGRSATATPTASATPASRVAVRVGDPLGRARRCRRLPRFWHGCPTHRLSTRSPERQRRRVQRRWPRYRRLRLLATWWRACHRLQCVRLWAVRHRTRRPNRRRCDRFPIRSLWLVDAVRPSPRYSGYTSTCGIRVHRRTGTRTSRDGTDPDGSRVADHGAGTGHGGRFRRRPRVRSGDRRTGHYHRRTRFRVRLRRTTRRARPVRGRYTKNHPARIDCLSPRPKTVRRCL